jgi:hypothetical protein
VDATNAGTPGAGGQLSGDVTRMAAIKRMQKLQTPVAEAKFSKAPQSSGPNTGATGLPKPEASLVQRGSMPGQSPHPPKPRRI